MKFVHLFIPLEREQPSSAYLSLPFQIGGFKMFEAQSPYSRLRRRLLGPDLWFSDSYPPSSLVVVQIHHQAGALVRALGVALLPLARVHELLGEPVAVVEVVAAAAPQPIPREIFRAGGATAPAAGELALPAGAAHGVHHPGRADGVGERGFPAACEHRKGSAALV